MRTNHSTIDKSLGALVALLLAFAFAAHAAALEPNVPAQSGDTILVAMTPSDDSETTVLLVTSLNPNASTFLIEYRKDGVQVVRVARRVGTTPQAYAVIVIRLPLKDLQRVLVEALGTGVTDVFGEGGGRRENHSR